MAGKRKNYSAEFKAKVALEAIRGDATITELTARHGVHQTVINTWKRQALDGMAGIFSSRAAAKAAGKDGEIGKLHAKIGQLVVERDFLAKASGRSHYTTPGEGTGFEPGFPSLSHGLMAPLGSAPRRLRSLSKPTRNQDWAK